MNFSLTLQSALNEAIHGLSPEALEYLPGDLKLATLDRMSESQLQALANQCIVRLASRAADALGTVICTPVEVWHDSHFRLPQRDWHGAFYVTRPGNVGEGWLYLSDNTVPPPSSLLRMKVRHVARYELICSIFGGDSADAACKRMDLFGSHLETLRTLLPNLFQPGRFLHISPTEPTPEATRQAPAVAQSAR